MFLYRSLAISEFFLILNPYNLVPLTAHTKLKLHQPNGLEHRYYFKVTRMKLKSTFSIQDKNIRGLDNSDEYLTLADLMAEQGVSTDLAD